MTIGDIVLFSYVDLLSTAGQPIDPANRNFVAWYERMAGRPSASASIWPEQPMGMRG